MTFSFNPYENGPFDALMQNGQKYGVYPCSVVSPADPKILSEDVNKISKSHAAAY
jgi:hypothetical protein